MALTPLVSQLSQIGLDSSAPETTRWASPVQDEHKDPTERAFDFTSDTLGGVESLYESDRIIPSYVVDSFLKQNPRAKGYFCVFQPTFALERDMSIVVDGLLPQSSTLKGWKGGYLVGHLFEMTWWGTLRYYGKFREEREKFGKDWESTFGGCIAEVNNPTLASLPYIKRRLHTSAVLDVVSRDDFVGDISYTSSSPYPGSGSFRRLFGEAKSSSPATQYLLWIELPRLFAYIISWDMIEVKDILWYIESGHWRGSDSYDCGPAGIQLRVPVNTEEWKGNGWSYTERKGMEVLVE
ncbi:hypothetical protein L873DRAFT_399738 [Choiromyces venosus 120613-1]|uniref:Uncharacterized protein n=1 Tax=Choiromyces venosus 120613-1 TaxID=1336337 RepID=A0A3N4IXM0_9PEZI|nr:hypothetical protein L873DRAFT_399738 [Choiromyces venosus 120613-1]